MFFLKLWLRFKWEELAFLSGRWFEWVTWPFVFFLNSWRRWSLFFWTGHIQYIHLKLISRPENWWLEDDCLLGNDLFSGTMFVLESVTISKKDHQQNFQGSWATRRTFGIFRHCVRNCFRQLLWPSEGSGLGPGIIELQISMVMWPGWHWFLLLQLVGWEYYLTLVGRCCLFYLEKCHLFKMSSVATWWLFHMSSFDLYELVSRCRKIVDTWNVLKLFRVHIPRPNICPSWGFFITSF